MEPVENTEGGAMADDSAAAKGKGTTPPYVSFVTLKTFLQDLHEHGVPGRVDNSVLKRFSGGVGKQLMTALRFVGLIDAEGHPTEALRKLAAAFGTDQWPIALEGVLRDTYQPIFNAVDLEHATPHQLRDAFRKAYQSAKDDVLRKSEVFFVRAVQEAGIPLSKRVVLVRRASVGSPPRRRPSSRAENGQSDIGHEQATPKAAGSPASPAAAVQATNGTPGNGPRAAYDALSAVWDPDDMDEEVDAAVVTVLRYLRRKAKEIEAAEAE
jgi:Family of unknown function (DUF5343)